MSLATLSARFPVVDLAAVHDACSADRHRCTAAGAAADGLAPLALVVDDVAVTLLPGTVLTVTSGVDERAMCVVRFRDARAFSDFHHELRTVPGAQITGAITYERGGYHHFDDWEPALRALYQGRPAFDPATVDRARAARTFVWGVDADETIGAHVAEFGFAVVHDVISPGEVAAIDGALREVERSAAPDTPRTWWTRGAGGEPRVCQIHYATERAATLAALDADERMTRLANACIPGLVPHADRCNGHFAVLKQPGATEGMTDLPWHVDCGLGGHTVMCPGLHIGIQLTASNPSVGAFAVVAGSHASSVRRRAVDPTSWPVVVADARPGDVTIHVPHVMHAAPAPEGGGPGRRTLYLGYGRAEAHELIGPGSSFDDLLTDTAHDGFVSFDEGSRPGPQG